MSEKTFDKLDELQQSQGAKATIEALIESLRAEKDIHKLFEAMLLKQKFEMGLPLVQPTSFDSVPTEKQEAFEEGYIEAAREVGNLFLAEGNIPQAWNYFRTIREPEKVAQALEKIDVHQEATEETEELINVALYEGAHPVKGLELMLRSHGTCNTVTAMDQQAHQLEPTVRKQAASLLIREIYNDLCYTLRHEIEQKVAAPSPQASLRELMKDRDWLFDEGNYHIDVSHLHSIVRFARFLDASDGELAKAIELAEYGAHLAAQLQYPGDAPFDDFYVSHQNFFHALADERRDEALDYFRAKLKSDIEPEEAPMIAYVLVDLLVRCDRIEDALLIAQEYLTDVDESSGFSFPELCQKADRLDALRQSARTKGDLVVYTAALLEEHANSASA